MAPYYEYRGGPPSVAAPAGRDLPNSIELRVALSPLRFFPPAVQTAIVNLMADKVLVRYGAIPEVARFGVECAEPIERGAAVVVRTHRGLQVGTLLQPAPGHAAGPNGHGSDFVLVRPAEGADRRAAAELRTDCETQFNEWRRRIEQWNLDLQLIDLEWTLDRAKLILYVLNERGPDCTKLALHAAAAGLGLVEVQPVDENGLVALQTAGGCGSGGCGSGGCHA